MRSNSNDEPAISLTIPSVTKAISAVLSAAESFVKRAASGNCNGLLLVIRELVHNAIVHGNRSDPEKTVAIRIARLPEQRFSIEVQDEGEGFAFDQLRARVPAQPRAEDRRGYLLIFDLADSVQFTDGGRHVFVVMGLDGVRPTGAERRTARPSTSLVEES